MSIIVVLIGLLVPALSSARRYALTVKQNAQFHSIKVGLDLFHFEYGEYPDSAAMDDAREEYYGAMKLCEAMVGQDQLGFHPESRFRLRDTEAGNVGLYHFVSGTLRYKKNLKQRKGAYLPVERVEPHKP